MKVGANSGGRDNNMLAVTSECLGACIAIAGLSAALAVRFESWGVAWAQFVG
jgi:hypothetical protein